MIAIIDNYDSFTYNLYQIFGTLHNEIRVFRNDAITLEELIFLSPQYLVISPGPGTPAQAGISKEAIETLGKHIPTLGVCLGHQAIGEVFGGRIVENERVVHGKTSAIHHDGQGVFAGIEQEVQVMRYHSLIVEEATLPQSLTVTARTREGEIMGLRHDHYPIVGVQFHPESIMTPQGVDLLKNFLKM